MGLFSKKTVIQVSSVIYPLGEEPDEIPDVVKAAIVTAGVQKTPVSKAIKDSIIDGIGVKIAQGYAYAVNTYYAGLPSGLPSTSLTKNDPTLELLTEEYLSRLFVGDVVDVVSTTVVYANDYDTVVRDQIFNEFSYDFFVSETFASTGAVNTGATLELTGPFLDPVTYPGDIGYHLVFTNPDTSTETFDRWYDADLFEFAEIVAQRIVMEYNLNGDPHETISYIFGGSDARLNIFLRNLEFPLSGTFPSMVLKKNNVYIDDDAFSGGPWETSDEYRTTRTYGLRFGINIDDILVTIKDNPDEEDIDYAFIQPGTLINSFSKSVLKYHYNYFNRLRLNLPNNQTAFEDWVTASEYPAHASVKKNQAQNPPSQSVRLADPETASSSLDMELAWRYISYEEKSGVIDEYEIECGSQEEVRTRYVDGSLIGGGHKNEYYDVTKLYIRKALSDTTYAELCICGLWHENYVYKGHSVQSGVWDAFNDIDGDYGSGFLIPLDYTIFVTLSPRERLQLGQEAFFIIFNCYVEKKLKWYQTGIFKVILVIVAIVITYFTWGAASAWVAGIYQGFITAGLTTIAAAIATATIVVTTFVGVSLVAKEAGQWAAEHWGAFWGALVTIGATILLTWGVGVIVPGPRVISPTTLIQQVARTSSYILTGMSAYTEYTYVALTEQQQEWEDYLNTPNDALETINDALEEMFPELSLTQKAILPHPETLDEFMARTLGSTDTLIGRLTMPITNMAELTLTPRLI